MIRNLAFALRLLRKSPAFAITCTLIVALGIGATTAIFSIVYGVTLRPLPYRDPDRLVSLWTRAAKLNLGRVQVNAADHREWQARNHVFEEIALARTIANFNLTGDGEPERLFAARVSASTFRVLGVAPAIGRAFVDEENQIGHDRVVILSDGLWRRRFGRDPSIVGRAIMLSGVRHTVVGIMDADFNYPSREIQVWTPLTIDPNELTRKITGYNFVSVARLKPGVTLAQAQADIDGIARKLASEFPKTNNQTSVEVVPMLEDIVGGVRRTLYVLLGAVSCLLLIACLNLANLLAARSAARAHEFAVRLALGASRTTLAVQAVAEAIPIVAAGGAVGIALARLGVAAFVPVAPPGLPRLESIAISFPVLIFSVAILAATALVAGLLPATVAWRSDSMAAAREHTRSLTAGRQQSRMRATLVVAQVALVLPLLVAAGLLMRSFAALVSVDSGFRSDNVQTLQLAIPRSKYASDEAVAALCTRILERVSAVPGVASAAMVNRLPLAGTGQINMLEFETADAVKPVVSTDTRSISPDYFRTAGIRVIDGRAFTEHDSATINTPTRFGPMPPIGIVDERIARTVWPGESALGKRFRFAFEGMPWMTIVGVVGHIRNDGLDVDPRPQAYFSYLQRAQDRMALVVRGHADARLLAPVIVQAVREVDPEQPVYDVRTFEDVVERSTAQRWLNMTLIGAFALIALLLASIGLYGVVSYGVTRERREFGIRLALGAGAADITRLVVRRGTLMAGAGVVIGLAIALTLARVMQSLLFGIGATDPASFAAATLVLTSVALLASYLPARRAAAVDPAVTLRSE
jgi:putative ABC transport system permease protein